MTKHFFSKLWILEIFVVMIIFAGCEGVNPRVTEIVPSNIPVSQYDHYLPSRKSIIRMEFEYPSDWVFRDEITYSNKEYAYIRMFDPKILAVPTISSDEPFPIPSNFGRITISVEPFLENESLDIKYDNNKQALGELNWVNLLNEYQVIIDGNNAKVLECQIEPFADNGFSTIMFERNIFIDSEDQFYWIIMLVSEDERGGEFEQGYEHFFNSIKIVE